LQKFSAIKIPVEPEGLTSNWQSYMIGLEPTAKIDRNTLMTKLYELGIPTRRSVMATHLEFPYRGPSYHLPHTEYAFENNILLPMHPGLSDEQQTHIINSVENHLG
jgi:dTDP-4-amino-4,6-dideoxygalactose transaminase